MFGYLVRVCWFKIKDDKFGKWLRLYYGSFKMGRMGLE